MLVQFYCEKYLGETGTEQHKYGSKVLFPNTKTRRNKHVICFELILSTPFKTYFVDQIIFNKPVFVALISNHCYLFYPFATFDHTSHQNLLPYSLTFLGTC